jgi:trans-aconitate methyltransferase
MSTSATPRGLLFGSAAESYERFRLGYPDEVVDRTLGYADRPVTEAVEIGAGTGKATRAFASRGVHVTALEPDQDMCAVLRRETLAMPVSPVHTSFEDYEGKPVGLVYAAAAMHWTDPSTRWARVRDLLDDTGVALVFGCAMEIVDPEVAERVRAARRPQLDDDEYAHEFDAGLTASGLFADIENHVIERETLLPQREYVGYLSTVSAYLQLSLDDRQAVLRRVADVLPEQVRIDVGVGMTLGRRL